MDWHLDNLRNELERQHWKVVTVLDGNGYDISAVWVVGRPDGSHQMTIEFEGLDDMETLPVEKAYGCRVREAPRLSLYFRSKQNDLWKTELREFIGALVNVSE